MLHADHAKYEKLRRVLAAQLDARGAVSVPGASRVSPSKAREILRHGTIHGEPLSRQQRGLFGLIAGGGTPSRRKGFRG